MKYRTNWRTGDKISEIGMGTAYIVEADRNEAVRAVRRAYEGGINYFDLAAGDGTAFSIFGEALSDVRDQVMYQIHFGADYSRVTYGWTLDLDAVKRSVDRQLRDLKTDYINYGFIHCMDSSSDWARYQKNGILQYLLDMKNQGVVRHVVASSHTPAVIRGILDADLIDMLMFSINPAYDYHQGEYAYGSVDVECEKNPELLTKQFEDRYYFFKLEDESCLEVDYSAFALDESLKGEFVRTVMAAEDLREEEKAEIIRYGIQALAGEEPG